MTIVSLDNVSYIYIYTHISAGWYIQYRVRKYLDTRCMCCDSNERNIREIQLLHWQYLIVIITSYI